MMPNPVDSAVYKDPAAAGDSLLKKDKETETPEVPSPGSPEPKESGAQEQAGERQEGEADADQSKKATEQILQDPKDKGEGEDKETETPEVPSPGSPEPKESGAQEQAGERQEGEADADQSKKATEQILQDPKDKGEGEDKETETPEVPSPGSPEPKESGAQEQAGERQEGEADADQSKKATEQILQDPKDKGEGEDKETETPEVPSPGSPEPKESGAQEQAGERQEGEADADQSKKATEQILQDPKDKGEGEDKETETPEVPSPGSPEPKESGAQEQAGERQEGEADADQSKKATEQILQDPKDKGEGDLRQQEKVVAHSDEPPAKDSSGVISVMLYLSALVAVLAIIYIQPGFQSNLPPVPSKGRADIFNEEIGRVKLNFPSQRAALWRRSGIHLTRHLEAKRPTEPVSMILTSGRGAEKTLRCLAVHIAKALSAALNTSVLEIDGTSKASLDSDQVKLDIDEKLNTAFGMKKGPAVIHRLEEFPPGSTLIFYRYCDHENAAFKEASLIFTVLLEEVEHLEPQMSLSDVEEMVQDHVKGKFLSSTEPAAFDKMDVDKLGGLWSRISHLVLPVAAEKDIELEGCRS
ncbi:uncharacterized protein [Paramormyrops kingsleyae]